MTTKKAFVSGHNYIQDIHMEPGIYTVLMKVKSMYGDVCSFALFDGTTWTHYDMDTVQGQWKWAYVTFRILVPMTKINLISRNYSAGLPVYVVEPQIVAGNVPFDAGVAPADLNKESKELQSILQSMEYLKHAIGQDSEINGALVTLVTMLLKQDMNADVTAGISGIQLSDINDPDSPKNAPALWAGGTYAEAISGIAKAIIRHDGFAKFEYGEIGGWNIGSSSISKNNVSLRSDGSIANGSKWALCNDGSGLLASGNIKWNSSGVVSIASAVKIGSSNLDSDVNNKINNTELVANQAKAKADTALSDIAKVKDEIPNENYLYEKNGEFLLSENFPRTGDHKVTLSIWGDFSGYQNEEPYDEISFQGSYDSYIISYKYKWKSDNHIVYEGGTLNLNGDSDPNIFVSLGDYEGTDIEVRAVKLEMGDKATYWTPSPEDTIGLAKLDETIIDGGFIKTSLIEAKSLTAEKIDVESLFAQRIEANNLHISGESTFGGELNAVTGTFRKISGVNDKGETKATIYFNNTEDALSIDGRTTIGGDLLHQGHNAAKNRDLVFFTSCMSVRGSFGASCKTAIVVTGGKAKYYYTGLSNPTVYYTKSLNTRTFNGIYVYQVDLAGNSNPDAGIHYDLVVFSPTSREMRYELTLYTEYPGSNPLKVAQGKEVSLVNADDNNNNIFIYINGFDERINGGEVMDCLYLGSLMTPNTMDKVGGGWLVKSKRDNNW